MRTLDRGEMGLLAKPHPALERSGDAFGLALGPYFGLELRHSRKHMEGQPASRRGRVNVLIKHD
jgi:hypothetical protein